MSDKPKKAPAKLTDKQREALDKGRRQLTKGDERTKAIQAKGVAAAVQKRQEEAQARTFAAILAEELNMVNEKTGQPRKNGVAKKLVEAMEKAKPKEAAKLFEVLRDTLGEAPTQKIDINANVKTIGNWRDVLKGKADELSTDEGSRAAVENVDNATDEEARTETDGNTNADTDSREYEADGEKQTAESEDGSAPVQQ